MQDSFKNWKSHPNKGKKDEAQTSAEQMKAEGKTGEMKFQKHMAKPIKKIIYLNISGTGNQLGVASGLWVTEEQEDCGEAELIILIFPCCRR